MLHMYKPFAIFVGLRYVRAKRRNHFISFISLISINDLQRRAARYREMRALLQEVLEWHSITSFSESN